ncbi:hypothetical protein HHO41_04840 [Bacillus sp. DNRA2]|uniref:hypothetical protein n=1 Tax=Bacillus sp. DNRA2 TaxID=2723053 RepID=UPI00145DD487|nr:hypothetical protein [Bacillus sp. DNRA2]NMD69607.1 hypothetical protein [Bacillus sp. DNRA2]
MEIYLTRSHTFGGVKHDGGKIYEYDDANGQRLVAEGYGVPVNFPTIQGYSREISRLVKEYRKERDEIAKSERYRDNEAEREFQLKKLRIDLDEAVAEKKDAYEVDLEVAYRENAAKAFEITIDDTAKAFVDAVKTQFSVAQNKSDLADMLVARLKNATPEEKAALSMALNDISIPSERLDSVKHELKGAAPGAESMQNCAILSAYKQYQNPAVAYEQLKAVSERER